MITWFLTHYEKNKKGSNLEIPFSIDIRIIFIDPYICFHSHLLRIVLYMQTKQNAKNQSHRKRCFMEMIIFGLTSLTTPTVTLSYSLPSTASTFSSSSSVNPISNCTKISPSNFSKSKPLNIINYDLNKHKNKNPQEYSSWISQKWF